MTKEERELLHELAHAVHCILTDDFGLITRRERARWLTEKWERVQYFENGEPVEIAAPAVRGTPE